ncbi:MAG: glutamate racemase, partial [Burkholderiales bacterium]|nr:glutamate racemase [Burkholderiales bacterium]
MAEASGDRTAGAPVAVYDSGFGGLSVLLALRARLPALSYLYVADSGHAPYGDRDPQPVRERALAVAAAVFAQGARALVVACNTASVLAAAQMRQRHAQPIVAMEPAIKPAVRLTRSGVVLVLATRSTVHSEAVAALCRAHGAGVRILLQACPGLVEQVERGACDDAETRALLERHLAPGLAAGADTIVLGCTHYAFLAPAIRRLAGPGVTLVEPSPAVAAQLARRLGIAASEGRGRLEFHSSGDAAALRAFLAGHDLLGAATGPAGLAAPGAAPGAAGSATPLGDLGFERLAGAGDRLQGSAGDRGP